MDKDAHLIFEAYQLNGKSKGQSLEDLAKKHQVDLNILKAQLDKGIKTEHEHTKNELTAKQIAMDHLAEDPKYYDKLAKMESENQETNDGHTKSLSYTHERIASMLPKDIEEGKSGEIKILNLAAPILAKLAFNGDEEKASKMMYYDEDFNSDLVSTYRYFQKHGFPDNETPEQYVQDSEKDYASQKIKNEENENQINVAKYKAIIDDLSKGAFDTESKKDQVDQGVKEGVFDVEVVNGKRQVVLTNAAIKKIENAYPELKDKFWECGRCKADYPGCGEAKREQSEDAEMPTKDFNQLKQHINKGPIQLKKTTKELPYTHKYIHPLAKQDSREEQRDEDAEKYVYDDIEVAFNLNGKEYVAYGDVHFGQEDLHGKEEDTVENFVVLDAQTRQEVQDNAVLRHGYNAVYNAGVNKSAEEEERRLDSKCWKGYHKQGTKLKGGVRVNNCVKNK